MKQADNLKNKQEDFHWKDIFKDRPVVYIKLSGSLILIAMGFICFLLLMQRMAVSSAGQGIYRSSYGVFSLLFTIAVFGSLVLAIISFLVGVISFLYRIFSKKSNR